METKATLVTNISRIVQDASYDSATILKFINRARKMISGRVLLPALRSSATVNTVPGFYAAPMPDDYQRECYHAFNTTTNRRLDLYRSHNLMIGSQPEAAQTSGALLSATVEPATPQAAVGTITVSGLPVADETFVIDDQTFTFKVLRSTTGEVTIGADAAETCTNIVTAITADLSTVTAAVSGTTVVVTSVALTAAANDIVFTEDASNISVDGNDTLGGTQLGVKTAWLKYMRSPTSANAIRVSYYAFPTDLSADADQPVELPDSYDYDLIVNSTVFDIFTEIYSEDNPGVIDRWEVRKERAIDELELFLGPYAREPEPPKDYMDWDEILEG